MTSGKLLDGMTEPESTVYLDARFLRDIAAAVVAFTPRPVSGSRRAGSHAHPVVKLELFGRRKCVRFTTEHDGQTMTAILMPVRPGEGWSS